MTSSSSSASPTPILRRAASSFYDDDDEGESVNSNDDAAVSPQDGHRKDESKDNNNDTPKTSRTSSPPSLTGNNSILGDFSLFRDFFLAAFSDGYSNVACCGSEGLFPGGGCSGSGEAYCMPGQYKSARVAPIDRAFDDLQLVASGSSNDGSSSTRKKRSLAVAVGYKYAEDMNGRPIIITPAGGGVRRTTTTTSNIGGGGGFRATPSAHPATKPRSSMLLCDWSLFPTNNNTDTEFHNRSSQHNHVSCKPSRSRDY